MNIKDTLAVAKEWSKTHTGVVASIALLLALPVVIGASQTLTNTQQHASVDLSAVKSDYGNLSTASQSIRAKLITITQESSVCPISTDQTISLLGDIGAASSKASKATKISANLSSSVSVYKNYFTQTDFTTVTTDAQQMQNDFSQISVSLGNIVNNMTAANTTNTLYQNNCLTPGLAAQIQNQQQAIETTLNEVDLKITQGLTMLLHVL